MQVEECRVGDWSSYLHRRRYCHHDEWELALHQDQQHWEEGQSDHSVHLGLWDTLQFQQCCLLLLWMPQGLSVRDLSDQQFFCLAELHQIGRHFLRLLLHPIQHLHTHQSHSFPIIRESIPGLFHVSRPVNVLRPQPKILRMQDCQHQWVTRSDLVHFDW